MTLSGLFPFVALAMVCFTSCGVDHAIKSANPTKFLTSTGADTSARSARLPFEHSWRDPSVNITDYKFIVVRPVTKEFLHVADWERSKSSEIPNREAFVKRTAALARHFTKRLNVAFSDPICIFYKTDNVSHPETLVLEVALTEARFPDRNASQLSEIPVCGFEARVRDAKTGKLIATASDRRGPDIHVSGDRTHITDNGEICSIWARQLMEASNKEIFETVRRKLITVEDDAGHDH